MPRAVIYTAIFGGYDVLKQPALQDSPCDFICFTDAAMPAQVGAWRVIRVRRDPVAHPRMRAKFFKLLSHKIFRNGRLAWRYSPFARRRRFDMSIWVDGSLQIKNGSFVRDMREKLGEHPWAMFAHPWRNCIYEEARASLELPKYQKLPILEQVDSYRSRVPVEAGLYACGVIVRREAAAAAAVRRVNELWWSENLKWTFQDQLSLPYALQLAGGPYPGKIPGDILANEWFDFVPHNSEA